MDDKHTVKKNVNVERRTWDAATYEARAKARAANTEALEETDDNYKRLERVQRIREELRTASVQEVDEAFVPANEAAAGPAGSKRAFLTARKTDFNLESKVGSTEIISEESSGVSITDGVNKRGAGWYCRVCDCTLMDSSAYLDHINGKKHQRALGFSMRVEQSSTQTVLSKLEELKRKKLQGTKPAEPLRKAPATTEQLLEAEDEEKLKKKEERRRKKEERKRQREEDAKKETDESGGGSAEMAALMGFSGFS